RNRKEGSKIRAVSKFKNDDLPRALNRIGHVLAVRRGEAHTNAEVRQLRMRVMPPVEFGNGLGITLTRLGLHQYALLEMRLEQALEGHEKRRAVVTMPIGVSPRHYFRVVDLYFHLRVARERTIKRIE